VYGSPISIETSSQDEEVEVRPNEIAQEEKYMLKNQRNSEEGFGRERTTYNLGTRIGGNYSKTKGRTIKDAAFGIKTTN